jgi:2-C-methyl-D-erythritol 4-phosphate cytidylyltransferase
VINYWVLVPAAGKGQRMASELPKQYLQLAGKAVIAHTLERLLRWQKIQKIYLILAADDHQAAQLACLKHPKVTYCVGGDSRSQSVYQGLLALSREASDDDWVLVHDGARPCLCLSDIEQLTNRLAQDKVGGLLATPLWNTIKQTNSQAEVVTTLDRNLLWQALTPQMFRVGSLRQALANCLAQDLPVTDEASAIESLGLKPKLVMGRRDNIKITCPGDLPLAEFYLAQQSTSGIL